MSAAVPGAAVVLADGVGWVEHDAAVYPARLPDGPPLVLTGTAVVVWHAVLAGGTVAEVAARVAQEVGEPADAVAAGVVQFVDGLVEAGVLTLR